MTASAVRFAAGVERQAEGARLEVDLGDGVEDDLGAEALGLLAEDLHQLGALDAVLEAGVVLDFGRDRELAAGLRALDDERLEARRARRRARRSSRPGRIR